MPRRTRLRTPAELPAGHTVPVIVAGQTDSFANKFGGAAGYGDEGAAPSWSRRGARCSARAHGLPAAV